MATTQTARSAKVMPAADPAAQESVKRLDDACNALAVHRTRPLLVLYYPAYARMTEGDLDDVYHVLRNAGLNPEQRLGALDVLIDSYGGDPVAGYRLAQLVRSFTENLHVLVAEHAYSAATLFSFAGNKIRLAHYAGLSPIDITLVSESGRKPRHEVELATVDSFMDFAVKARRRIEELIQELGCESKTNVDSDVLVAMVKDVGALQVGKFFRERTLTGYYAEELLDNYMFASALDRVDKRKRVIVNFLFGAPSHEIHLDYRLAKKWNLEVEEMSTQESDFARAVTDTLDELVEAKVICPSLSRWERMPFIRYYQPPPAAGGP